MLIRLSNGSRFQNSWVSDHGSFYFTGIYIESGNQNHVLLSILNEHKAVVIHAPDVAGTKPVARQHYFRGFIRTVPVALHHLRPANANLPKLAQLHVFPGVI